MKICFIAPLFEPWGLGGAEKYVETLVKEFSKENEIFVITTQGPKPRENSHENSQYRIIELKTNLINLHSFVSEKYPQSRPRKFLWYFLDIWSYSVFSQIKTILKKEKPDVVHSNGFQGFSGSMFSAVKSMNIPLIHTLHNYELISHWAAMYRNGQPIENFNFFDRLYMFYMKRLTSNISAVISPSKFLMDLAVRNGYFKNSERYVIPNGHKLIQNVLPKQQNSNEFLYLGRLEKLKGVQIAISAIKKNPNKDIKFHIVGQGPHQEFLHNLAKNDERIVFHGYLSREKLEKLFQSCSFAIFPSLWFENFPLVLNDFMNNGLPVIASNLGAIPEIVHDQHNGILFEPGNSDHLSKIITKTMKNSNLLKTLSRNAIESSLKFPIEKQFQSTFEIYQNLTNRD